MTPAFTSQFNTMLSQGRAFKACIATLLDIQPKDFPSVEDDLVNCPRLRFWLWTLGYHWIVQHHQKDMHKGAGSYECILVGYGKNGNAPNSVVARSLTGSAFDWQIMHDPSEGSLGMQNVLKVCYLVPNKFIKVPA